MTRTLPATLAAVVFAGATFAAAARPHDADADFVRKAAAGGMAEVADGQLAAKQGSADDVRSFGRRMVRDHSKANRRLKTLARHKGIALPDAPPPKLEDQHRRLADLHGEAFDRAYAEDMVRDHEEDVALFREEADSGQDPALKHFAASTLPTLEEHLRLARRLDQGSKRHGHDRH